MKKRFWLGWLLPFVPKNHLSVFTGWLVHLPLPGKLGPWSVQWFVRRYRIEASEAEKEVLEYKTIGDLFVRRLKTGVRPVGSSFVVHACDAVLTQSGLIGKEGLFQAKGKYYSPADLLQDALLAARLEGGHYATYYLCPTDYHRVHSPVDGLVVSARHVPGKLWPVNDWSVTHIRNLFSVNERVITEIDTERGRVVVVMVGATNVGRIKMEFDTQVSTNGRGNARETRKIEYAPPIEVRRGQELGRFEMGSTVIVLFEEGVFRSAALPINLKTKVGESFGE